MSFLIDAWLERDNPYLRVVHKQTGKAVLDWRGDILTKQLNSGSICIDDFSAQPSQELIKELFVLDCVE